MRLRFTTSVLVLSCALAALVAPGAHGGQPRTLNDVIVTFDRVDRFERWLKAVSQHEPGETDDALTDLSAWSPEELRALWADAQFLSALMRNLKLARLSVNDRSRGALAIVYPSAELRRMRAFACAVSGRLASPDCIAMHANDLIDDDLRRVAADAAAARDRTGEDNYILRRAALLHTDVEVILRPELIETRPSSGRSLPGPHLVRADTQDGVSMNVREVAIHWEIARMLLDRVRPKDADRPQPGRDPMVRDWYRATAAWMQHVESHETSHIDRGRDLFPNDPDLNFLSGTLHEIYAMPGIQSASRALNMPTGFSMDIGSGRSELRMAEGFLRRALEHAPQMAEAHLRLGRVLGLQGHHADALSEIRQALTLLDDELLYDAELFAGAEEEALGQYDAAAEAYESAASRYPGAQSPLIALSQLARRRGDRNGALAAIERMFALPQPGDEAREDPWWAYKIAHVRNADELLDRLRAPFKRSAQ
ncbi:MAG TPA: hypothetical protein VKD69_14865 [Vicinamibacterales bacterium]|nr:hypothetical protein [Vicinamibacterales bacterium]